MVALLWFLFEFRFGKMYLLGCCSAAFFSAKVLIENAMNLRCCRSVVVVVALLYFLLHALLLLYCGFVSSSDLDNNEIVALLLCCSCL